MSSHSIDVNARVLGNLICQTRSSVGRPLRLRGPFLAAALAVTVAMLAACAPPDPGPGADPLGLRTSLVRGGIELTWNETGIGMANGYQVQYGSTGAPWTDIATGNEPTIVFTDVTPLTRYWFRVRVAPAAGATGEEFGPPISTIYVEPTLPIMRIETQNHAPILDKTNYVKGSMSIDPNGSDFDAYSGTVKLRGRGNSTWQYPKKPYKLKLDSKSALMGLASNKNWVLLANAIDQSQLRTYAAAAISEATDLAYTPGFRHVEVILNGDYVGIYQLAEPAKLGEHRVNIDEMTEDDNEGVNLTGGYLLEIDGRLEENNEPGWRTPANIPIVIKEPDPATAEQSAYIRSFVQSFENDLFSPDYTDPNLGYARLLDVDSFIDLWIVQELTRNQDAYWSSTFFYKPRGLDKLIFGPMWDFDVSIGNVNAAWPQPPEGWYTRNIGSWNIRLFSDPAFVQKAENRWNELTPTLSQLPAELLTIGTELAPAVDNDALRWGYPRLSTDTPQFVADWLNTRINWMTTAVANEG